MLWSQMQGRPDPRITAIQNQGYPTTLAELNAWYPAVPAERNAALICLRAFDSPAFPGDTNLTEEIGRDWVPVRGAILSAPDQTRLEACLAQAKPVLELLHSLPAQAESRYPVDCLAGMGTLLPHLPKFRRAVNLLGVEMLARSARGDTPGAIESLLAANRLSLTLAREPLLVSQLVRMGSSLQVLRCLEALVNAQELSADQLRSLQAVTRNDAQESLRRGLAGERACGISCFMDPTATLMGGNNNFGARAAWGGYSASGVLRRDRAFYLDTMSNYLFAVERPFPEGWRFGQAMAGKVTPSRFHIISRMLLPALGRSLNREAEWVAHSRVAEVGLAVERFRRDHSNQPPAALAELVRGYLAAVPEDPFDGQPLRYRVYGDSYVIYSVGSNLKDDGGRPLVRDPKKSGSAANPHDLCFSVGKDLPSPEPEPRPGRNSK